MSYLKKLILGTHEVLVITEPDIRDTKGPRILYANSAYYQLLSLAEMSIHELWQNPCISL